MRNIKNLRLIIIGSAIVLLFILGLLSVTTIKSGEVGIRVRFGKVVDKSTSEGINFKIPLIERIERLNVKVQKAEVTTESSSKDLQEVNMSVAVNYRIEAEKAVDLYKNVGTGYVNIVLAPAIEESIKSVTSKYTAEELKLLKRNR